jgi:catechol 2,3-dioxygenase-like lactoylglutathione lyase family enzyme
MIRTKGVVHFSLGVSDIATSARFFEEILGVEVLEERPAMAFLKTGNDCFALVKSKNPIDPNPGDEHNLHHAFWVDADAYDDAVRFLGEKGIRVFFEEDRPPPNFSGRRAYFHDPDRNVIEIIDWTNPSKADPRQEQAAASA